MDATKLWVGLGEIMPGVYIGRRVEVWADGTFEIYDEDDVTVLYRGKDRQMAYRPRDTFIDPNNSRFKERKRMFIEQIKQFQIDRLSLDEILAMLAFSKILEAEYAQFGAEPPDW